MVIFEIEALFGCIGYSTQIPAMFFERVNWD